MAGLATFKYYRDHAGKWRWRLRAPNGEIIADSGQGYHQLEDCFGGIDLVKQYAPTASVEAEA